MSRQTISAKEHLAKFGLTVKDAEEFIEVNLDRPGTIFDAALDYGVTTKMISEITNHSQDIICDYFTSAELECTMLDNTSILLNSDFDALESLVDFNKNTGILSNNSIREQVIPLLFTEDILHGFFKPIYSFQGADGLYDDVELGVEHLDDVSATDESIESLFYGTLINMFSTLDASELTQINEFHKNGETEDFQALFIDALSDKPDIVWPEERMLELVTDTAANVMNGFFIGQHNFGGILDPLLMGFEIS